MLDVVVHHFHELNQDLKSRFSVLSKLGIYQKCAY